MTRVLVVINKWWEADAVLDACLSGRVSALWPATLHHPRKRPQQSARPPENALPTPRAVYALPNASVAIWCVSDLLEDLEDRSKFQSSSERKAERLPRAFGVKPDLVIAVGTAAYLGQANGSVTVGTAVFAHDFHPGGSNPDSRWSGISFDTLIPSTVSKAIFDRLTSFDSGLSSKLTLARNVPSAPSIIVAYDGISLGTINVTNAAEFKNADRATQRAFDSLELTQPALSYETTHAVIRAQSDAPFIFVSGIANELFQFDEEVRPNEYAQNMVAAHNAGVVLASMLASL